MLRIYFVEDSLIIRENLMETLAELADAVSVGFSETEQEAKAWLTAHIHDWDVAIVDLFLRQGIGIEVVAALCHRPADQKVVVLSNYLSPEVRERCARLGADKIFDKTNEIEALIQFCKALAPM